MTKNKPVLSISGKDINVSSKKIYASKETATFLAKLISEKMNSAQKPVSLFVSQSLTSFSDKKNAHFFGYNFTYKSKDQTKTTNNINQITPNSFWTQNYLNKLKIRSANNEFFIVVSSGRNPQQYGVMIRTLIDIAGDIGLDLNIIIRSLHDNFEFVEEDKQLSFKNFIEKKQNGVLPSELSELHKNICFKLGQPNTGKSFSFEENNLFKGVDKDSYFYYKELVCGGINSDVGLKSTDISINYNPATKSSVLTPFLKTLMSAIVNKDTPHVIFLDDFHNVDISALLSPYMGALKTFYTIKEDVPFGLNDSFDIESYTKEWNKYIQQILEKNPHIESSQMFNKTNGQSIKFFAPKNLYILGAANWNRNTKHIFADIRDRAQIKEIKPSTSKEFNVSLKNSYDLNDYNNVIHFVNNSVVEALEEFGLFNSENKYLVGEFRTDKLFKNQTKSELTKEVIKNDLLEAFDLIFDSIDENGRQQETNEIGYLIIKELLKNETFEKFIIDLFSLDENIKSLFEEEDYDAVDSQKPVNKILSSFKLFFA